MIAAQFSIPYVAAVAIVDRELGIRQFTDARIHDPAIIALERKVRVAADASIDARYPQVTPTRVEITLRNGERLQSQVDMPKGDPRTPMTQGELLAKFDGLAGLALDRERVERVKEIVLQLEHQPDLSPLFTLLEGRTIRGAG